MTSSMIISCPKCAAKMSVPVDYAGIEGHCLKCKHPFMICEPERSTVQTVPPPVSKAKPPVPQILPQILPKAPIRPTPASRAHSLSMAGWICFFVGMALLVLCPIIPFYSPFFLASFVLAIVLLVKEGGTDGLALLLMTLLMPTIVGGMIFLLGVGATLSAFSGFAKEVKGMQNTLFAQQTGVNNQLSGQPPSYSQPAAPQPAPSRPMFFQPPAAPVQPSAATPLPAREVTYDGLLLLLNRYGIEFKSANTSLQKQDIRTRAQKEAATFVENARMTLAGTVSDVQYGADGMASLAVGKFAALDYERQPQKTMLFIPATGKIKVPLSREAALAIKSDQKVWITGRIQLTPTTSMTAGFGEIGNPSILMMMFSGDYDMLLTMRIRDYTVSFEEKQAQTTPTVKKPYSLIVVPPKASPTP